MVGHQTNARPNAFGAALSLTQAIGNGDAEVAWLQDGVATVLLRWQGCDETECL